MSTKLFEATIMEASLKGDVKHICDMLNIPYDEADEIRSMWETLDRAEFVDQMEAAFSLEPHEAQDLAKYLGLGSRHDGLEFRFGPNASFNAKRMSEGVEHMLDGMESYLDEPIGGYAAVQITPNDESGETEYALISEDDLEWLEEESTSGGYTRFHVDVYEDGIDSPADYGAAGKKYMYRDHASLQSLIDLI